MANTNDQATVTCSSNDGWEDIENDKLTVTFTASATNENCFHQDSLATEVTIERPPTLGFARVPASVTRCANSGEVNVVFTATTTRVATSGDSTPLMTASATPKVVDGGSPSVEGVACSMAGPDSGTAKSPLGISFLTMNISATQWRCS